ncbi:phosphatase PAP2 family protein [Polymorphobacter arshaanensis]|uniref:Acid phosphatase n=1 Tax=Glacieibacterium arshaanense TaxID=2511025 RepID=A0A4Y9EQ16_9SPHN|nr:phosphatase PAP2 family protein [Polymorphobacter arshaanensis]TFU05542.1 phosphatase PAP2 family protein [Polymorphobacter arshaanensis]
MRIAYALPLLLLATGAVAKTPAPPPESSAKLTAAEAPKMPPGYLAGQPPVDILKLLPPPPAPNSAGDVADRATYAASALGIDGPAWKAAQTQLSPPDAQFIGTLACAMGVKLSRETTPATLGLLFRSFTDFVPPMNVAKDKYMRPRPFTTDDGPACDPKVAKGEGAKLGPSYPSGHSGIGWLIALVLGDAAPAKATALREWGADVGQHRIDCRVHWTSDVAGGKILAVAVYDRIAATPAYQADVKKAAAELAAAPALTCPAS